MGIPHLQCLPCQSPLRDQNDHIFQINLSSQSVITWGLVAFGSITLITFFFNNFYLTKGPWFTRLLIVEFGAYHISAPPPIDTTNVNFHQCSPSPLCSTPSSTFQWFQIRSHVSFSWVSALDIWLFHSPPSPV